MFETTISIYRHMNLEYLGLDSDVTLSEETLECIAEQVYNYMSQRFSFQISVDERDRYDIYVNMLGSFDAPDTSIKIGSKRDDPVNTYFGPIETGYIIESIFDRIEGERIKEPDLSVLKRRVGLEAYVQDFTGLILPKQGDKPSKIAIVFGAGKPNTQKVIPNCI